jgi:hypothetical protein
MCRPNECGGLGLLNSKKMNIALMLKWVWKLYQPENPIWAQIIRAKYDSANNIFAGSGQGGSQFWRSIHKIKHLFKLEADTTFKMVNARSSGWKNGLAR